MVNIITDVRKNIKSNGDVTGASENLRDFELEAGAQNRSGQKKETGRCAFSLGDCMLLQTLTPHSEQFKKMQTKKKKKHHMAT